jgi:hypothetical protein
MLSAACGSHQASQRKTWGQEIGNSGVFPISCPLPCSHDSDTVPEQIWPRPPLHWWGIPPTREDSPSVVPLCVAHCRTLRVRRGEQPQRRRSVGCSPSPARGCSAQDVSLACTDMTTAPISSPTPVAHTTLTLMQKPLPPPQPHSSTSSALKRTTGGRVRPKAWAVLRLMTNSKRVGRSTGTSRGVAPFRILSTKAAARR